MIRATQGATLIMNENGNYKTVPTYSYVVTICEIDGDEVKAVRYDGYERKNDVSRKAREDWPGWRVKTVNRLYDADFLEEHGVAAPARTEVPGNE